MGGFLILALSIPGAFDDSGLAFGLAYAGGDRHPHGAVHAPLIRRGRCAAILGVARFNVITGRARAGGRDRRRHGAVRALGDRLPGQWVTPKRDRPRPASTIAPGHFVERHGLVVIVAIGESVVAIGIGAQGLPDRPRPRRRGAARAGAERGAVVVVLRRRRRPGRARDATPPTRRDRPLLAHRRVRLRPLADAAGDHRHRRGAEDGRSATPATPLGLAQALFLAGGAGARSCAGDVVSARSLRIGSRRWRAAAAVLALAAIPLGTAVAGVAQLAALVVVLAGAFALERAQNTQRVAVLG